MIRFGHAAGAFAIALVAGAAVAVGCGIDAVGEAVFGPGDGGGERAGFDACAAPSPEICDDGIDNDCNRKTDCDDPACSATACVPSGWQAVAVVASREGPSDAGALEAGCPEGWKNPIELVEKPSFDGGTCTCACNDPPAKDPCRDGVLDLALNKGNPNCTDGNLQISIDGGGCTPLPDAGGPDGALAQEINKIATNPLAAKPESCPPTIEKPPILDEGRQMVCIPEKSGTCSSGACIARPAAGTPFCVVHPGTVDCPAGFPSRRLVAYAAEIEDDRVCGCTCTANATTCTGVTLRFWADSACANAAGERTVALPANCSPLNGANTATKYFDYVATASPAGCTAAAPTVDVDGGIVPPPESTLCCESGP